MDKVEEAYKTLKDEGLKLDLLNMLNMFSKYGNKSSIMKCFTNLSKFDNIIQVTWKGQLSYLLEMARENFKE